MEIVDVYFTEVGTAQKTTIIEKNKWYDLTVSMKDMRGWNNIKYADVWFNNVAYMEGNIANRGGSHYASSSYIWSYSLWDGSLWSRQTEGTTEWTNISGTMALYTDDENNKFTITTGNGYANAWARVKILDAANEGDWYINSCMTDKDGIKSELVTKAITVIPTQIPPPVEPPWYEKYEKEIIIILFIAGSFLIFKAIE